MSRKKDETDEEYYNRRHAEYEKYYKAKVEHEIQNGIELLGKNIRVSDFTKEKILSGKVQPLIIDGALILFRKKTDNGYWFNNSLKGTTIYLHREKLRLHLGLTEEQMKGLDVHHIDGNKDNNDISNLRLITKEDHRNIHHDLMWTEERREKQREIMNEKVRPAANKWHGSKEGRAWHKKQYKISLGKYEQKKVKKICEYCGAEYEVNYSNASTSRFCSNKCKSAWRRHSGKDNVEKICEYCGKKFITNKYSNTRYCNSKCAGKASSNKMC